MYLYIPQNLNIEELISINKPKFKPFKVDKLCYILHLIYNIPLTRKEFISKQYIPINAVKLQAVIKNYWDYLEYLIKDLKIIESDRHYIVGEKSRGFRFVEKFRTRPVFKPIKDFTLKKRLWTVENRNNHTVRKLKYLTKWFDGLEIDLEKVQLFLKKEYELKSANKKLRSIDKEGRIIPPKSQYFHSIISCAKIDIKDFNLKRDNNVMRFHSNLTNMRSIIRNALTYKGKKLFNIDLKNSQPYLSIGLINNNINKLLKLNSNNYYIMLGETLASVDSKGCEEFIELVSKGDLYDFLGDIFQRKLGIQYSDKRAVKEAVFLILFTDNRFIGQKEAAPKRIFKNIFPKVYEVFAAIKRKDSTLLPRLLQYVESRLFVDIISKRISKELPDAPIFTIHDSIATTKKYLDKIENIISEELEDRIGYKPKLQIDNWDNKYFDEHLNRLAKDDKILV